MVVNLYHKASKSCFRIRRDAGSKPPGCRPPTARTATTTAIDLVGGLTEDEVGAVIQPIHTPHIPHGESDIRYERFGNRAASNVDGTTAGKATKNAS